MPVPLPGRTLTARRQRLTARTPQRAAQRHRRLFLPHPPEPPPAPVALPTLTVEAGFGSWPFEDQASTVWTDITSRVRGLALRAGRSSEDAEYQAATMRLDVDNKDRGLDPTNLASPYRRAVLEPGTGSASTPDAAIWDWTTSLDVRVLVHDDAMFAASPNVTYWLADKGGGEPGATSSWWFYLVSGDSLRLQVSNGTLLNNFVSTTFADAPLWDYPTGPTWLRATWQVSGGIATVRFYRRPIDVPDWVMFSELSLGVSVMSLNNSAFPVAISHPDPTAYNPARVLAAWLDDTIDGAIPVGAPDFTPGSLIGDSSFVDAQGNTWTVNPPAVIADAGTTVLPGRRVRARATYGAAIEPVFSGFLTSAPVTPSPPQVNDLVMECVDATERLSVALPHESVWALTIVDRQTNSSSTIRKPFMGWYRLGESAGFAAANSAVLHKLPDGEWRNAAGPTFAAGTASVLPYSSNGAGTFNENAWVRILAPEFTSNYAYTIECWVQTQQSAGTIVDGINLRLFLVAGTPRIVDFNDIGFVQKVSTVRVDDGKPHHIVATIQGTDRMWIDGQPVSLSSTAFVGSPTDNIGIGARKDGSVPFGGTIDEVILYGNADPGGTLAAEHYTAGSAPWDGDTPAQRINRILDLVGWPVAERSLDDGAILLTPEPLGVSALSAMRRVAAADHGRLFIGPDGHVTFHAGNHEQVTEDFQVRATWGDAGGAEHPLERSPKFAWDTSRVVNSVSGAKTGGAVLNRVDRASQLDFGERHSDLGEMPVTTDSAVVAALSDLLARRSQPRLRVEPFTVRPMRQSADMWRRVLASRLGHHHVVTHRPATGTPIEIHGRVEQIAHSAAPGTLASWATTFVLGEGDLQPLTVAIGSETVGVAGRAAGQTASTFSDYSAYLYLTANQTLGALNTFTVVDWGATLYDHSEGGASLASNNYTILESGLWSMRGGLTMTAAAGERLLWALFVDGAEQVRGFDDFAGGNPLQMTFTWEGELAAGAVCDMRFYQANGTLRTALAGAAASWWAVRRVR